MGKLLLITGDLATGKSTFANILSERYGIPVFCKDSIKEVLGDTVGFRDREENLRLSKASAGLMAFLFQEFAKRNKPLILESNFRSGELDWLHEIAASSRYQVLTLVLRGEIDCLYQRYLVRMRNENRHPVHLSAPLDIFQDFKKYVEQARAVPIKEPAIQIDATNFLYQTDETLLMRIDQFFGPHDKLSEEERA